MGYNREVNTKIPVMFQKIKSYKKDDTRFLKVRIWLMHLHSNLNGSYFSKEVVEKAIDSLANTPILAYIEDNSEGEKDFSDHRMVLIKDEDGFEVKYIGQAIGVIPESNNATFETRLCDDGIEREFLVCDGLIWQKWDDPIDIFERDVVKSQSMELHEDFTGEFKDDGLFHFNSFKFFGACALGADVIPAMVGSTIEAQFSYEKLFNEIQEKMERYKSIFSKSHKGGSDSVDEKLELLKKYSLSEDDLKKHEIDLENYSLEGLENKLKDIQESKSDFSLTGEQFVEELNNVLRQEKIEDDWGDLYSRYVYVDYKDNEVYVFDRGDEFKLYGFSFQVNGDSIAIDFETKKRKKFEIVDFEEGVSTDFSVFPQEAIDYQVKIAKKNIEDKFEKENKEIQDKYSKLETIVEELKNFKATKLQEERLQAESELFERFSQELTEDEIIQVKEKASDFSLEELEEKLYTIVGKKKAIFSKQGKKEKSRSIKIDIDKKDDKPSPYGGIFEKYSSN